MKAGLQSNALTQRVNAALKVTTGSAQAARDQLNQVREFGRTSPISLPVWLQANQQLMAFGVEAANIVPMLAAVQDAVIAAGGTEEEIRGVIRALGQMQSKGKLSAEELNQIGERGIDAAGIVADAFGTTAQDIRAQITAGTITVDEFFDGFVRGSKAAFGGAAQNARLTFDGMLDRIKGAHRRIGEILASPLIDPEGGGALVTLGNSLADAMNNLETSLRPVVDSLSRGLGPAAERAGAGLVRMSESITSDKLFDFVAQIKDAVPILSAFATVVGTKMASGFVEMIPGLQRFAGAMSPLVAGVAALAATSPELRSALGDVRDAIVPLIPVATSFAITIAEVLAQALKIVVPILTAAADVVKFFTENVGASLVILAAVTTALYVLAAAQGVNTAATFAAAVGVVKLREAFVALGTVIARHPLLLAAGLLLTGGAILEMFYDVGEASQASADKISNAMAQVRSGADTDLGFVTDELQNLIDATHNRNWDDLGFAEKLNTSFDDLGKAVNGNLPPATENIEAFLDAAKSIDEAVAEAMRSGIIEAGDAYKYMTETLGLTQSQLDEIKPFLTETFDAQMELRAETERLSEKYGEATVALRGFYDELKGQTDPYFGLIKAQGELNDAIDRYNEILADPKASEQDKIDASLKLTEAWYGLRVAGEDVGALLGEDLPQDFKDAAIASGIPKEAIDLLEETFKDASSGIVDANDAIASSTASAAAEVAVSMGLMDEDTAELSAKIVENLGALDGSTKNVDEAFRDLAARAGITQPALVEAMQAMRDAGYDFSQKIDDYLDSVGTSFAGVSASGSSTATTITEQIRDMMAAGQEMAQEFSGVESAVASAFAGISASGTATATSVEKSMDRFSGATGSANLKASEFSSDTTSAFSGLSTATGTFMSSIRTDLDNTGKTSDTTRTKTTALGSKTTESWNSLRGASSPAWNSIRNSIQGPVKHIIDKLYNRGIKPFWDRISKSMFGGKGILQSIPGFATGGFIRGAGTGTSDSILARLSNGEFVMRKKAVDNIGVHNLNKMNNLQQPDLPGFWAGGLVSLSSNALGKSDKVFDVLNNIKGFNWSKIFDLSEWVTKKLSNIKSSISSTPSDGNSKPLSGMLKAGANKVYDRMSELWEAISGSAGGFGGGPGGYKEMFAWIKNIVPGASLNSGLRPGDPGYHGRGLAVDLGFSDRSEYRGGGMALKAFNAIANTWRNGIAELIWDYSPYGNGVGVWNGNRHKFTSPTSRFGTHGDHIHWAQSSMGGAVQGDKYTGSGSGQWSSTVTSVLRELGLYSPGTLSLVLRAIQKESSGNPRSINLWDSNAKAGIPSKGLLQTIDPTFNAYAGKYRSRGPYDPYANIYAAIRYAMDRYGSGWAARMARPGGYAAGGLVGNGAMSYDSGGYLQPGYTLAYNGTGKPEPVGHDLVRDGKTEINIDMSNSVVASKRDFQDMLVEALQEAARKGRLRNINIK